jgi:hypothetical protein
VFPVLLEFGVSSYPLYPGKEGAGLAFPVAPGVSIIAGINGLGKTTLLQILFRVLSGPVDWKKRKAGEVAGSSNIDLGAWRDPGYFKNRVPNAGKGASATALIGFGEARVQVTRSLESLAISELTLNGVKQEATRDRYQEIVCELSGLARYADFFVLLRYLVFYLEERQPLIWDPDAQSDVLRLLFFDTDASGRARALFDEIQREDSEFRNLRASLNKMQERLGRSKTANGESAKVLSTIKSVGTTLRALDDRAADVGENLEELDVARRGHRLKLEQAKIHLTESQREYESAEKQHFAQLFPTAEAVAANVLVQAVTGGGCLVCGTRGPGVAARLHACAADKRCPVCESPVASHEGGHGRRFSAARLRALDEAVQSAQESVAGLEAALRQAVAEYDGLVSQSLELSRERDDATRELRGLQASLPLDDEQLGKVTGALNQVQAQLNRQRTQLRAKEREFATVLASGEARVRAVSASVSERFTDFARYFLADEADLVYDTDNRQIGGDTGRFAFPRFVVRLTSTTTGAREPRRQAYEVSESQREFLDLAFRMALIDVATTNTASMLVLETPEASLDSVFMLRAGELLGRFAARGDGENRLIASSNLTRGEMISALLGAVGLPGETAEELSHHVRPSMRAARVLNLLEIASPNAALSRYRREYERDLKGALFPKVRPSARSVKKSTRAGRKKAPSRAPAAGGRSDRTGRKR